MNAKRTPRLPSSRRQRAPRRLTLRISLRDIEPVIWREITVPDSYTLLQLHRCIQLVFDWLDYHLFEFQVGPRSFEAADPDATGEDAGRTTLAELGLKAGSSLLYVYDMGDAWEHDILVQAIERIESDDEPDLLAYVIDGARAAPPEDVGGPPGYERLLLALRRGSHDDDADLIEWAGPGFDPELFDRRSQNHALILATTWGVI
jgi:hypothetical protein